MEGVAEEVGAALGDLPLGMNDAPQEMPGGFPVHEEIGQEQAWAVDELVGGSKDRGDGGFACYRIDQGAELAFEVIDQLFVVAPRSHAAGWLAPFQVHADVRAEQAWACRHNERPRTAEIHAAREPATEQRLLQAIGKERADLEAQGLRQQVASNAEGTPGNAVAGEGHLVAKQF